MAEQQLTDKVKEEFDETTGWCKSTARIINPDEESVEYLKNYIENLEGRLKFNIEMKLAWLDSRKRNA